MPNSRLAPAGVPLASAAPAPVDRVDAPAATAPDQCVDRHKAAAMVATSVGVALRVRVRRRQHAVALLLLGGLSTTETAALRRVREHAGAAHAKAGPTGRAAPAAFVLEDPLAPAAVEP